ncbi:DUF6182 family protein [Actinomadura roseirufa]|uniref:DUF6182 family protein n=1 Tax=Actinomadura roseirufa TaxID=2094049 RepID=UPI001041899D|nr:DUF6182 family protein [Actinomadura roseirufa]
MLDQRTLRTALGDRLSRAGRARPRGDTGAGAVAVLRDARPAAFAVSVVTFAERMPQQARDLWYGNFTRTIFLAGIPGNLAERFPYDHLSEDESIAWYGPGPLEQYKTLRRLLRPVRGTIGADWPDAPHVALPGAPPANAPTAHLRVALQDLRLQDYLVHVGHTLAEAVLDGLLTTSDVLRIEHVPRIPEDPGPYRALRVSADPQAPERLRAFATLSVPERP